MEYNSTRNKLIIAEYGRNVQKMIEFAVSVEDRDKRNQMAKVIIRVMGQINPHLRDVADFTHKLWDHLFIISDFKLDVDSPYPIPTNEILSIKPEQVPYTDKKFAFRHYGRNIELMIEKANTMEDGPAKERIVHLIANHLKKSYLTWNRDSVDDEVIVEHLNIMSKGQLKLSENFKFNSSFDILAKNKPLAAKIKPGNSNNTLKRNNPIKKSNNFTQPKRKEN
ncbi:MAG: DUF4290 domain-containing protein [Bacteroidales bacterium]